MNQIEKLEIKRQLFHMGGGMFYFLIVFFDLFYFHIWLPIFFMGIFLLYLSTKTYVPIFTEFIKHTEREGNHKLPGKAAITYFLGVLLTLFFFEKNIALASILILAIADSTSHLAGRFYGQINIFWNRKKNWEGLITGVVLGGLMASSFVPLIPALIASTSSMLVESFDLRVGKFRIDDNMWIPVLAGFILTLI